MSRSLGTLLAFGLWVISPVALAAEGDDAVDFQRDVVYGNVDGQNLVLDVALPKDDKPARPALIWIHGGGWQQGNKSQFESMVRESAKHGYVAVSVGYRLAPKHLFPAQVEDCKCAVRWLRANAEKYHVDPNRIGAVGGSAGAHLAMMLGAMDSADGLEGTGGSAEASSRVQAVVSYAGPTNLQSEFPIVSIPLLATFLGGRAADKPEEAKRASPITYVTPGDPPMLLFQGTRDPLVPHAQAIEMVEALTKAKVPGRVELMIGEGHGWATQHARVTRQTFEFLDGILKP